ncbi:MAG: VWA domain-containing protein [Candidatus Thiodiazotropha sp. (ex Ctena orbiculata)]|uniref:VWA domain-containing protein n=1 Tax=Candidatus Thiodiazotropha taylori TaxID=2792791 RepID=A0A944MC31_9GAMM|nr:VWA domain-containing protein [Candidatus Thiodiazotropha taylori]MBV2136450.1 VWA domain-containing protein [Candidatus Thiodiazotropha taylori]
MTCKKPTSNLWHSLSALALTSLFAFTSPTALSDDIEVYLQEPPDPVPPNILFVLDESGSMDWGSVDNQNPLPGEDSRREELITALSSIINNPAMGNVNAALLGFRSSAVILTPHTGEFKVIGENTSTFLNQINNLIASGGTPTVPALEAAVNWFRPDASFQSLASPLEGGRPEDKRCAPNHIILLTDGSPNSSYMSSYEGNVCEVITYFPNYWPHNNADAGARCANEIATWAQNTDLMTGSGWDDIQNITTHTIGFHNTHSFTQRFLNEIAENGGGTYSNADSVDTLVDTLTDIITNAQTNIDYAYNAPTIPFNSDNTAVSGEYIYVPMFLPEDRTFWKGNLKKYRITVTNEDVVLTALNNERVLNDAQEFQSTRDLFCDDDACDPDEGNPLAGGVAQDMTEVRNLYTYLGSDSALTSSANRVGNSNTAITTGMLGVATEEARTELLNWVTRDPAYIATADNPSHSGVMGAPIHTQPIVVNYSDGDVVLIPTSEGVLEAIDARLGEELWAFMPQDLLPGIRTIKNNDASSTPYYGLDGPMTYYEVGNEKMVIIGMRRGGRKYHILNVTDRLAPEYVAEISSAASTDFSKLGQTWSKPLFVKMEIGGNVREVLVFGGGYDPDQDNATPPDPGYSDDEGNAIFIVNADDGTLLRSISNSGASVNIPEMTFAIASDLATIDLNGNAIVERLYASDVGGRIIRIDIDEDDENNTISGGVVANINDGATQHRKFFSTPQIGYYSQGGVQFLGILIGTGDIANPIDSTITDRFYMIKDTAIWHTPDWSTDTPVAEGDLLDASDTVLSGSNVLNPLNKGWYVDFTGSEKSFSRAILYDYSIFFTTYSADTVQPDSLCEAVGTVGTARIYGLNMIDANGAIHWDGSSANPLTISDRVSQLELQGIPPSPLLIFPGGTDDEGNTVIGKKIFLFSDLKKKHEWSDRFRPIYWEEVINE